MNPYLCLQDKISCKLKNHKAFIFISLPLILFFYLPALFYDFAFSDDYYALWQNRISNDWTNSAIIHGRPLQGIIISTVFSWAETVSGIWKIRLLGILILISISYMLYKEFLLFFKGNPLLASIFSTLPVFLPSFEIITIWSSAFPAIVSLALSLLAGKVLFYENSKRTKQLYLIIFSFILLITSLLTYQATVAACFIPWLIRSPRLFEKLIALKLLLRPLLVFIFSNLLYITTLKIYQFQSAVDIGRSVISNDIQGKISWFFKDPFILASSTFATLTSNNFRSFVLTVTILLFSLSIFIFVRKLSYKNKWWFPLAIIFAIPLSYYTSILAAEHSPSYRTQAVLSCVFIFGMALINYELIANKFRLIGAISLLFLFFIFGVKSLYNDFVFLQNHDWKKMIQTIESNSNRKDINLIRTSRNIAVQKKIVTRVGADEFGIPGSSVKWATEPMIKLIIVDILNKNITSMSIHIFNEEDTYSNTDSLIRLNSNFNYY